MLVIAYEGEHLQEPLCPPQTICETQSQAASSVCRWVNSSILQAARLIHKARGQPSLLPLSAGK